MLLGPHVALGRDEGHGFMGLTQISRLIEKIPQISAKLYSSHHVIQSLGSFGGPILLPLLLVGPP